MARTPLFHTLQQTLAKACWARRRGLTNPDQCNDMWQQLRMNRRQFLQRTLGTAVLAGVPLVGSGCYSTDDDDNAALASAEVAIIGAGIAGLHCAFRLQQAGVRARVFEANTRAGGRMFSDRGLFAPGQVIELGGEFIDSNHPCMFALADEFGLQVDDVQANDPPDLIVDTFFFNGREITEAEIIALFTPIAQSMADTVAAVEASDDLFDAVDAMSIPEYLVAIGVDPLLQEILEVAYLAEFGLEADAQSIFNLLCFIDFENPDPFRIFGESDERFRIHAGNDSVPTMLADRLNGQIEFDARLVAVNELSDGRFRLTFVRSEGATFEMIAEHVVFALPLTLLRQVELNVTLTEDKQTAILQFGFGTNAKVIGGFTSRVWREQLNRSGGSTTDNGLIASFDGTVEEPGNLGILTLFPGGNLGVDIGQGTALEQMTDALPLIEQIFPGTTDAFTNNAVRMHWPTAPLAQGSYLCPRPGQTGLLEVLAEREGNLHFCGEHTSIDFFGFMEGGAESGAFVAAEILADMGIVPPVALTRMFASVPGRPEGSMRGRQLRRMLGISRRRPAGVR